MDTSTYRGYRLLLPTPQLTGAPLETCKVQKQNGTGQTLVQYRNYCELFTLYASNSAVYEQNDEETKCAHFL